MLVRGTLARLKLAKSSARNLPQLHRVLLNTNATTTPLTRALPLRIRTYATTTATKPKVAAAKKAAATKSKKTAAKKTTTKKPAAKKAAPKKKKKAVAKPKPKPKKKVLTEEQKERRDAKKARDNLRELKAKALKEPKALPASAFSVFLAESVKKEFKDAKGERPNLGAISKSISERYKNLSPSELEHYNHLANEAKAANAAAYKKWVESYTPAEIRHANHARQQLKRKLPGKYKAFPIRDERLVKGPKTAYLLFSESRWASGDYNNIPILEVAKLIGGEWKNLSASEKKNFESAAAKDKQRYIREFLDTYKEQPPLVKASSS